MYISLNRSHPFWSYKGTLLYFTYPLGPGYTRDWLPAYSFVSRTCARQDTTRQDCFVVIPTHTGVTIVYCGTVVPSCCSQMSARWLSIMSRNMCEHSVNKSEGDWLLGVLVLRWIVLRNGSPETAAVCALVLRIRKKKIRRRYWVHPIYSCSLLKGKFYTLYENLCEHPIKFFSYFHMNISTFDDQQLA